jgi:hypothetical protein
MSIPSKNKDGGQSDQVVKSTELMGGRPTFMDRV